MELDAKTIPELKAYAAKQGYTITKTKKAEIISEILEQGG